MARISPRQTVHHEGLVADKFEQIGLDGAEGRRLRGRLSSPTLKDDALVAGDRADAGADVLVVRCTQVTDAMLDAGRAVADRPRRRRLNTIDVAAASQRGIYVSNCPGKNAIAVAELAVRR